MMIDVDSDPNRVFHFLTYRITSVWNWKRNDKGPEHFSEVIGMVTPQHLTYDNWNQTTGFKGD